MTSGIYRIVNTVNGKFYVGSAGNISERWKSHQRRLNKGTSDNRHLQAAWKQHGQDAFVLEIVGSIPKRKLIAVEQFYLDKYVGLEQCYNIAKSATAPMLGLTLTEEQRAKIGNAHRGKIVSQETREKQRKYRLGTKQPREQILAKSGENGPRSKLTDENVKYIREWFKQKPYHRKPSVFELADRFGVCQQHIYGIAKRYGWKHLKEVTNE